MTKRSKIGRCENTEYRRMLSKGTYTNVKRANKRERQALVSKVMHQLKIKQAPGTANG